MVAFVCYRLSMPGNYLCKQQPASPSGSVKNREFYIMRQWKRLGIRVEKCTWPLCLGNLQQESWNLSLQSLMNAFVTWVQRWCDAPGPDKGCKQVNMLSIGGWQDGWLRFHNGNLSNPVASCYLLHNSPLRCFSILFRKVSQFQTLKALFFHLQ